MNRRNLKIINIEYALDPGLGLEINNSEFGVRKIVLLAMSCSINVDNFGSKLKTMWAREFRGREEIEETNRMVKINTSGHGDLFLEVRFQRTYSPLRRPQRLGLFQPFPSLIRSLRPVECFFLITRVTKTPQGSPQNYVSLACFTIHLEGWERDEECTIAKTKQQERQITHGSLSQVTKR